MRPRLKNSALSALFQFDPRRNQPQSSLFKIRLNFPLFAHVLQYKHRAGRAVSHATTGYIDNISSSKIMKNHEEIAGKCRAFPIVLYFLTHWP